MWYEVASQLFMYYLATITSLFPMVNPFSTIPLFLALTAKMSEKDRQRQGDRACLFAMIIMLITLFLGSLILKFFNISLPALRVAGGLIISFLGFNMLFPSEKKNEGGENHEADVILDYSIIPLALPSMAGAGTIAMIMTFSTTISTQEKWTYHLAGYGITVAAIITVALLCFIVLRSARYIQKFLGPDGLNAMTRIMGLIMVCIGVQFLADGVKTFVSNAQQETAITQQEATAKQQIESKP